MLSVAMLVQVCAQRFSNRTPEAPTSHGFVPWWLPHFFAGSGLRAKRCDDLPLSFQKHAFTCGRPALRS
eukprot:3362897-Amphidinium_carterae.1